MRSSLGQLIMLLHFTRHPLCLLLSGFIVSLAACPSVSAQGASAIEESDAILGTKPEKAATDGERPSAAGGGVGVADVRAVMLFHPLMQHLVSTAGNAPMLYFLPPTANELTKLFDERRARRLLEVRKEMADLAGKTSAMQQRLFTLKQELNSRLGPNFETATGPAKAAADAASRKLEEEGFWKRKLELETRLNTMNERYGALDTEIQDPLKLLEQTRQAMVARIRRETHEAIAHVAEARRLNLVLNAYSPAPMPASAVNAMAPETAKTVLTGNEYKEFLAAAAPADKTEPAVQPRRLLASWDSRGARVDSIFGPGAAQTALYGGQDITWPVLKEILVRYKVPEAQIVLLKAHFTARRER